MYIGYIYRHWIVNENEEERSYVGQVFTCKQDYDKHPRIRWQANGKGYAPKKGNKPTHFWKAICSYGWDNFNHDILLKIECSTLDELRFWLDEWEKYYIWYYDSYCNGYNGTTGWQGTPGMSGDKNPMWGRKQSDEAKKKISIANKGKAPYMKGKTHSEESKHKMSIKHRKENLSDETRKRMSKSQKQKVVTEGTKKRMSEARKGSKNPKAQKVICINTGMVFDTIGDALDWLKNSTGKTGDISKCCRGVTKTAGIHPVTKEKLRWKYYEE